MSSIASVTVTFPCPIAGADIVYAVRALSDGVDTWFRQLPRDGGTSLIGQTSSSPYRHLIVVPGGETPEIRPMTMYDSIEVRDYAWPGINPFAGDCNDDLIVRNVEGFAQRLERHFDSVTS